MSRRASDSAGSVLSFTFLDVLMCTMGSLLLLLVIFGAIMAKATRERREGELAQLTLEALNAPKPTAPAAPPEEPATAIAAADDPGALARQLEQLRREQADAERRLREAAEARHQEQARITHLEDHERRLEHDLGKLHITLQALQAAEQKQTVDREQAAVEAERLKQLIRDTEARLADMRREDSPNKSYAIVPYKGANGTFRRPVFIECTAEAVTIQPEGIVLTVADFDGPTRSGNPLAAAIRAAHEELNSRAVAAGRTDMPDPYPLIIVRPDGAAAYAFVLDAISSWESDYGYEFVEADWKLKYSEPDPRLARVMNHAVNQARERQALLAKVAPRRYAPRLVGGRGGAGDPSTGGEGTRFSDLGGGDGRMGDHAGEGALGDGSGGGGNPLRGGGGGGMFSDEFATDDGVGVAAASTSKGAGPSPVGGGPGAGMAGCVVGGGPGSVPGASTATIQNGAPGTQDFAPGTQSTGPDGQFAATNSSGGQVGSPGAQSVGSAANASNGSQTAANAATGAGNSSTGASSRSAASGGASSGGSGGAPGSNGGQPGGASMVVGSPGGQAIKADARRGSAADSRGANWANAEAGRRAAPITRPVKIQVTRDQLAVLDGDSAVAAAVVTFQQPVDGVLDQLASAVARQVKDWGLAGDGMYWRPVLAVNVAPGAERQAARLAELLDDSGIDVRLPQSVATAAEGAGHATR